MRKTDWNFTTLSLYLVLRFKTEFIIIATKKETYLIAKIKQPANNKARSPAV